MKPVLYVIGFTVCVIAAVILRRRKLNDEKACRRAGEQLLRERELDQKIAGTASAVNTKRLMVRLRWKDGAKYSYVFEPSDGIRFGRNTEGNDVTIFWDSVSSYHCVMFERNGHLYAQDLDSANGTYVIRHGRTYRAAKTIEVRDGDFLLVGDIRFRVHIFYADLAHV